MSEMLALSMLILSSVRTCLNVKTFALPMDDQKLYFSFVVDLEL